MLPSLIRTVVPFLVALAGPWALRYLGVTEADLSNVLTVVVGAGYYAVARLLEQYGGARFGLLLGHPSAPSYDAKHVEGN